MVFITIKQKAFLSSIRSKLSVFSTIEAKVTKFHMARKTKYVEIRPSFFKVLIGDFAKQLRIPLAFLKNLNGSSLGKCIVKSPTGRYWVVNVEEHATRLFFGSGWQEFVEAHCLEFGDFLVFKYCGNSKFKVKIYDKSCCEKVIKPAEMNNGHPTFHSNNGNQNEAVNGKNPINFDNSGCRTGRSEKKPVTEGVIRLTRSSLPSFKSENSCFIFTWRNSYKYRVTVPIQLVREKKLMTVREVVLKDPAGRSWPVELYQASDGRLMMKHGWGNFRRANEINVGDALIFEFTMPTILQVHIFREEGRAIHMNSTVFSADIVKKLEAL